MLCPVPVVCVSAQPPDDTGVGVPATIGETVTQPPGDASAGDPATTEKTAAQPQDDAGGPATIEESSPETDADWFLPQAFRAVRRKLRLETPADWSLRFDYQGGVVGRTHPLPRNSFRSYRVELVRYTDGSAVWHHTYRFPSYGVGVQLAVALAGLTSFMLLLADWFEWLRWAGVAYLIALQAPAGIFNLAVQYAFSGFASLFPLLVGALFWRGSTKWGALAVTLWTTASMVAVGVFQAFVPATAPGSVMSYWTMAGVDVVTRTPGGTDVLGFMPVVPMTLISAALMVGVSWLTPKPSAATLSRYF